MERNKIIALSVSHLAVAILGVVLGWTMKPDSVKVEEKVKVVEVEKQVVVEKEVVRVEVVRVKDTAVIERWRREKTETQAPDGTVTKKETEEKNIDTIVKEKETATQVQVVEVTKEVVVERDKMVEVRVQPTLTNWHTSLGVGVAPRFNELVRSPVIVTLDVERRVAGPFFVGGFVTAGSSIQAFEVTNAAVGVKIGLELP